ncbi:hypothetical protein Tco_0822900 [Tanacetum coccineum]|uniref:Uncharacterized protein n=1 Tax=Tanacetum coccineum TaxID=301880 RepID=A0ABQ5AGD6_9ASTR
MESDSYWLDKVQTSIWRDVRTLAIEEAYTTKYSIHPGADTMLCGFRLTNRWLSMKKDIASCGSKYLAYLEVEVEYQGSSGLLDNQSIEHGCLIGIGFVLDFVEFILFTFGDKEMISVIEATPCVVMIFILVYASHFRLDGVWHIGIRAFGYKELVTREDDHGVTEGREDVRVVFQQRGSGAKRKLSRCRRNQMINEPILALSEGADDFVVYYDARSKDLKASLEKGRRLTNRWLSMKKDIASCGSKYLAYSEVEVEYQGSSGLLLQPELPE